MTGPTQIPKTNLTPAQAAQQGLVRKEARRSLAPFCAFTHPEWETGEHHKRVADHLEALERGDIDRLMVHAPPRHSKALHIDTPIPTPSGWSRIADLRVGDFVFGSDGKPTEVIAVSEVFKNRPIFRVTTDDRDEILADKSHLWKVRLCRKHKAFTIRTTEYLEKRHGLMRDFRAPLVQCQGALDLPETPLPIHPYVLGVWLGDGRTGGGAICSADQEIIDRVMEIEPGGNFYKSQGITRHFRPGPNYRNGAKQKDTLTGRLRALGLIGNKRIPTQYLRSSLGQRLELLKGLVDTDGGVSKHDGQITVSTIICDLASDIKELVHSLGHKAHVCTGRATLNGIDHGPVYLVTFYFEGAAYLERKRKHTRHGIRAFRRYINIEPAGVGDTVCIQVAAEDGMYLCGRSMLPTHNSEMASRRFPAWYLGKHPSHQILLASYGDEIAEDLSRNVRNILRDPYYQVLYPETKLCTETTAAGRWETTAGGIFVAVGIGGAATGRGAHLGIIDDPVKNRMDADSPRIREVCWQWYHGVFRTRLMRGGRVLIMCTRWHEDDLAGRLLQTEGKKWTVLNLQAIENEGTDKERALWDGMYSLQYMRDLRSDLQSAGRAREWNSQYQQNPTPEEGTYVQRVWFEQRYEERPTNMHVHISSDYAVTEASQGRDPDWTVHGVFGLSTDGKIYVLDWWKRKTSPDVWIDSLIDLVARWKPLSCVAGKGLIRRAVEKMIIARCNERKVYFNQVWVDEIVDKAVKGRAFQARASMGNIIWPKYSDWADDAIETIVGFPTLKHDDDFDVLANMCLHLDEARPPMQAKVVEPVEVDSWKTLATTTKCDRWKVL